MSDNREQVKYEVDWWRTLRGRAAKGTEMERFISRHKMRPSAEWYATLRGWTVKLTPPQRSHR